MAEKFSRKTFHYLDRAAENGKNLKWFEKNRESFNEEVKKPFTFLLKKLGEDLGESFPGVSFHPARISLPVYRDENIPEDGTIVKSFSWAFLSEKRTSLFEWNPGINLYFGSREITAGIGLYHPSARQMALLRESYLKEPGALKKLLTARKFQSTWSELSGELYSRLPGGVEPGTKGSEYFWHKQIYVTRKFSRKEVVAPDFQEKLASDLHSGSAFLEWLRETVGIYERSRAA